MDIKDIKKLQKKEGYEIGEVCVWMGQHAAILRILEKPDGDKCYKATEEYYDSLHVSNLRIATPEEVRRLKNDQILTDQSLKKPRGLKPRKK